MEAEIMQKTREATYVVMNSFGHNYVSKLKSF